MFKSINRLNPHDISALRVVGCPFGRRLVQALNGWPSLFIRSLLIMLDGGEIDLRVARRSGWSACSSPI
jgi:hypothetical protein